MIPRWRGSAPASARDNAPLRYNPAVPVYLLGESSGGIPFPRAFFNTTFDVIVQKAGKGHTDRLLFYLSDGTTLDVCQIDELAEAFMVVRGYKGEGDSQDPNVNVIPYGLIYRIELGAKRDDETRVGFKWVPPAARDLPPAARKK